MYVLALVGVITPTMKLPSGVRSSFPGKVVVGRPVGWAGSGARVVVSAGTATSVRVRATGSNTCNVFCGTLAVTPVPVMRKPYLSREVSTRKTHSPQQYPSHRVIVFKIES